MILSMAHYIQVNADQLDNALKRVMSRRMLKKGKAAVLAATLNRRNHVTIPMNSHMTHSRASSARRPSPDAHLLALSHLARGLRR